MNEIWKDVVWYEWYYKISNRGRLKSLRYKWYPIERIIKLSPNKRWYITYILSKKWIKKNIRVHRLVWMSFVKWYKEDLDINHKNWVKHDNRAENLEWCTRKENINHAINTLWYTYYNRLNEIWNRWSKAWRKWKKVFKYNQEGVLVNKYNSVTEASKIEGIDESTISKCCNMKKWYKTAHWYIWMYC